MTSIVRKLWSFTAILIFSVAVNANLVPKKLLEFDLKEMTGKDAKDFQRVITNVSPLFDGDTLISVHYFSQSTVTVVRDFPYPPFTKTTYIMIII